MPHKTVAFHTLGCKLNFAETSTIGRKFVADGYGKVGFDEKADVYVINTCSVTDNADKKCRSAIRKALKNSPQAKIVVTGCYAQLRPDAIMKIPGVNLVLGTAEKFKAHEFVSQQETIEHPTKHVADIHEVNTFTDAYSIGDRTRTFLKVQDGCDYSCSFCTIPMARGKSRSLDINAVLKNAREVAEQGLKEVVLTGVNIGDFGKTGDNISAEREDFLGLIKQLDEVEGLNRIRISSIEPNLLNNDIIKFVAQSKRFVPHFHIPLQSGSNEILRRMKRRYLRELYADRVKTIKELMPHCCIGVDVIVGFPGETEGNFKETYNFLSELPISYLHVFTYSERPDTLAEQMQGEVDLGIRHKRSQMLRNLSARKRRYFYEQHLNQARGVLFESENKEGFMSGFTDNYIKVKHVYDATLVNQILPVLLEKLDDDNQVLVGTNKEVAI